MAHNLSAPKRHERIVASPLDGWREWQLAIDGEGHECTSGRRRATWIQCAPRCAAIHAGD